MSIVGEMADRKERPAYVRFERRAVEDKAAGRAAGKFVAKDVDFALVTPPYSRDVFEQVASKWLEQMKREVSSGRLPREWYERYEDSYERWKRGEDMPLNGTPIKGWGVISPAQQKNLTTMNILTVEDLAAANDEGVRRIGMGGGQLRDKAKAWISQMSDKGPLTMENAALKEENRTLKLQVQSLEEKLQAISTRMDILQRGGLDHETHFEHSEQQPGIAASDILEQTAPPPQKRGPGRPRKQA
jgi:hypothetical protein